MAAQCTIWLKLTLLGVVFFSRAEVASMLEGLEVSRCNRLCDMHYQKQTWGKAAHA